ncbi:hypothetical protein GCK72_004667 [Caenorhabditis remanei]|uniref:Uncharacterized protein n=1 Tax=Caenorhabditis remanei TaxID=31234 RepID=A0A6A5HC17_CAERE|nr:hypothetical protein GCK72_004667 [Caenorhabditis remanei]KAF1764717.1 hypothetical protein GCK72_004667 [Caenorhabditis remanei]
MGSLDELMNRVAKQLKEISEKDELVTEGIQKLDKCCLKVKRHRVDMQNVTEELREEMTAEQQNRDLLTYESEKFADKKRRFAEKNDQMGSLVKNLTVNFNENLMEMMVADKKKIKEMEETRSVMSEKIQKKL